jgi:DNA-binding NtrC family response regulator
MRSRTKLSEYMTMEPDRHQPSQAGQLKGTGPQMRTLVRRIKKLAPSSLSILIQGETGSGKELCARAIYQLSSRQNSPLVSVNCAAIPQALLNAELFGSVSNAYTNATDRQGLISSASSGTLFLDEIGDLSLDAQAALLRVLETGELRPLGSDMVKKVNIRLICATHKDLLSLVSKGSFRADLYHRISGATLIIPPLRERLEDLPQLVFELNPKVCSRLQDCAWDTLRAYTWPGNIRQLKNILGCLEAEYPIDEINAAALPLPQHGPWRVIDVRSQCSNVKMERSLNSYRLMDDGEFTDEEGSHKILLKPQNDKYLVTGSPINQPVTPTSPPPVTPAPATMITPSQQLNLNKFVKTANDLEQRHDHEAFSLLPSLTMEQLKVEYIKFTLHELNGNIAKTARKLQVSRNLIYRFSQPSPLKRSA